MKKQVLFLQGGGDDGYRADQQLADELSIALGPEYVVTYPRLASDENAPDFGWTGQIAKETGRVNEDLVVVAHSLGASMLLKTLSERPVSASISGLFLLAVPFWRGEEDWKQGLKLREDFADHLPPGIPFFFYHCRDDEEVPFDHLAVYRERMPSATFRELEKGGHLFKGALDWVVRDIFAADF